MVSGQLVGIGLVFLFNWMIDEHYYHEAGWVATGLTGYTPPPHTFFPHGGGEG
jgi:hypothetical protein